MNLVICFLFLHDGCTCMFNFGISFKGQWCIVFFCIMFVDLIDEMKGTIIVVVTNESGSGSCSTLFGSEIDKEISCIVWSRWMNPKSLRNFCKYWNGVFWFVQVDSFISSFCRDALLNSKKMHWCVFSLAFRKHAILSLLQIRGSHFKIKSGEMHVGYWWKRRNVCF